MGNAGLFADECAREWVPPTNPLSERYRGEARGEFIARPPVVHFFGGYLSLSPFIYYHGRATLRAEITRALRATL